MAVTYKTTRPAKPKPAAGTSTQTKNLIADALNKSRGFRPSGYVKGRFKGRTPRRVKFSAPKRPVKSALRSSVSFSARAAPKVGDSLLDAYSFARRSKLNRMVLGAFRVSMLHNAARFARNVYDLKRRADASPPDANAPVVKFETTVSNPPGWMSWNSGNNRWEWNGDNSASDNGDDTFFWAPGGSRYGYMTANPSNRDKITGPWDTNHIYYKTGQDGNFLLADRWKTLSRNTDGIFDETSTKNQTAAGLAPGSIEPWPTKYGSPETQTDVEGLAPPAGPPGAGQAGGERFDPAVEITPGRPLRVTWVPAGRKPPPGVTERKATENLPKAYGVMRVWADAVGEQAELIEIFAHASSIPNPEELNHSEMVYLLFIEGLWKTIDFEMLVALLILNVGEDRIYGKMGELSKAIAKNQRWLTGPQLGVAL